MTKHTNCTVTITSVFISGRWLYRLRMWDGNKQQIVALRVWANSDYKPGGLVKMQVEEMP